MKSKSWLIVYFCVLAVLLTAFAGLIAYIDPYFHYHKPNTDVFSYHIDDLSERNVNDGIMRNFDYDAIITGSSMIENFKASEVDELFSVNSIKVPFSGGTYKEIHDRLQSALSKHPDTKMIILGIDMNYLFFDKDYVMDERYVFPTYLYDDNPFNDINYLFNHDVVFDNVLTTLYEINFRDRSKDLTGFDEYANWNDTYKFGKNEVLKDGFSFTGLGERQQLTDSEIVSLRDSIHQNLTSLPNEYPNVSFYYFIPPYSAAWWAEEEMSGHMGKQISAEQILIEELLQCDNISLFGFDDMFEVTTDLNNYKDKVHYGEWINSDILKYIQERKGLLTKDNFRDYLQTIDGFYASYDFNSLLEQDDYENDGYIALLNKIGSKGGNELLFDADMLQNCEPRNAEIIGEMYEGLPGVKCTGKLEVENISETDLGTYLYDHDYCGIRLTIPDVSQYNILSFYGKKASGNGHPSVYIYNEDGQAISHYYKSFRDIDEEWHLYYLDLSQIQGKITVIMNGGCADVTGDPGSEYGFAEIRLQ